ncbi:hypothetical protein Y032_0006g3010 [Ancylostoma ceylanicum]|uniref:Uncharacterized protein n=1 Tax=Ancylostoma ceylanicum TaxID=53326 RepID=A0A016VPL9_9BILA|nr:hypothetical protein Y032_0006g3010 [Ancylostoma ceylanicum]
MLQAHTPRNSAASIERERENGYFDEICGSADNQSAETQPMRCGERAQRPRPTEDYCTLLTWYQAFVVPGGPLKSIRFVGPATRASQDLNALNSCTFLTMVK